MKRKITTLFLLLFAAFLGFVEDINAANDGGKYHDKTVNSTGALVLCEYQAPDTGDKVQIVYSEAPVGTTVLARWSVWLSDQGGDWEDFNNDGLTSNLINLESYDNLFGDMTSERGSTGFIHYNKLKSRLVDSVSEDNFVCPAYAFLNFGGDNELCLSETNNYCEKKSKFDRQQQPLLSDADTIFHEIDEYASTTVYRSNNPNKITFEEFRAANSLLELVISKTKEYVIEKYKYGETITINNSTAVRDMPKFIANYINNLNNSDKLINSEQYQTFQNNMKNELQKRIDSGEISAEEGKELTSKIEKDALEALNIKDSSKIEFQESTDNSCQGLLGAQLSQYLKNIFTTIQYLGPVLVAVLTIVDFIKTAISGEKENMQKDFKRFYKRIIFAMLLFFVPLLVNLILSITGVVTPSNCF